MIHVVVMKCLMVPFTISVGLPLLIYIELLWRSRRFKNIGVGGFVYRPHIPGFVPCILPNLHVFQHFYNSYFRYKNGIKYLHKPEVYQLILYII
jgi:hypothetical protein